MNPKEFNWISKSPQKIESKDVQSILSKNGKRKLPLFIKKITMKILTSILWRSWSHKKKMLRKHPWTVIEIKKSSVVKFVLIYIAPFQIPCMNIWMRTQFLMLKKTNKINSSKLRCRLKKYRRIIIILHYIIFTSQRLVLVKCRIKRV